jgi:protein TonB
MNPIQLQKAPDQKPVPQERRRAVFGISRRTLTEQPSENAPAGPAVEVKAGNTLATAPDDKKLEPGDETALPIPTEEYLVTQMPILDEEIRIPYPAEARSKGIEGPVAMDILIDEEGKVRDVRLLDGPNHGLNEAAMEAGKRLRFKPARIHERAVAVRIRYVYRFVLER